MELIINNDFKSALPAPRAEEIAELEKEIRAHGGCYCPLIVWRSERGLVLVDGHHRYEICRRLDLPFRVEEKQFESPDAALEWIIDTQVGRRNLTDSWSRYLLGRKYEALKRQGQRTDLTSGQNVQKSTAAEKIADETGKNEKTVRRAGAYARALDKIGAVNPEAKQKILAEEIYLTGEEIAALADRPAAIESLASDRATSGFVRLALRKERQREKYGALIQQGTPAAGEDWPLFTVVYADPPWAYENEAPATAASNNFPTLNLEQLVELWNGQDLKMPGRLTEHAALMLWATAPNLRVALEFMLHVGFDYKTNLIWRKRRSVIGAYSQGCHELLLIGIRGNLTSIDRLSSVFEGEPWSRLHSAKPDVVYDMIEAMFPEVYKLELFARRYRKGWATWGNELGLHEKEGEDDSAA